MTVKVARKKLEAQDICSFELIHPEGRSLPAFSAGAHIDVHVRDGLVRQYSLCNDQAELHRYVIGVLRDPASRGGSRAMHDDIREGDVLQISEPRNLFKLVPGARRSILMAGGIGITPILGMAEALAASQADFEMHYYVRTEHRAAFRERIRAAGYADRAFFYFGDSQDGRKGDIPSLLSMPDKDTHLYVCGPTGFIEFVMETARHAGWRDETIHHERFSAAKPERSAGSFDVKLASSGMVIRVAEDQSVTDALAANGIEIPVSCEQGICGTCLTRVLSGEIAHRDSYLTPQEQARNDQFTPCCSRAESALLVLDL